MKKSDWESLPVDDLWALYEEIGKSLASRILAEKQQLEKRLDQLALGSGRILEPNSNAANGNRQRRKYPKVSPKYQNPTAPFETWSGRGKQPRWLVSALKSGATMKDFEIRDRAV